MLTILLILIALVVIAMIAIKVTSSDTLSNSNTRKKPKKKEPKIQRRSNTRTTSYASDEGDEDPDAVLGLRTKTESNTQTNEANTPPKVITMNLVAPPGQEYTGYELLQAILATGLRFGEMKIFHRHVERSGRGEMLFSMTSLVEPGTFDLPSMGSYSTPGLTFFMCYNQINDPHTALDLMIDTVQELRDELGGDIMDNQHQPINKFNLAQFYELLDAQKQFEVNEVETL